jgi:hypothetical protein
VSAAISNAASARGIGGGSRLSRVRLPRATPFDGVLRPFESASARGQHLLRTAERGAYLGAADPFRRRGRYRTDVFLDIVDDVPGGHVAVLTNLRVLFLKRHKQSNSNNRGHNNNDDEHTPAVAVWDIRWENILAVELSSSSSPAAPRSSATAQILDTVVLHLKQPSKGHHGIFDGRRNDMTRTIQCSPGAGQAAQAWEIIHRLQRELGSGGGGGAGGSGTGAGGGFFRAATASGAGATGSSSVDDGWEGLDRDGDDTGSSGIPTTALNARRQHPPPDEAAAAWDVAGMIPVSPSDQPPTLPCLDFRLVWDSGAAPASGINGGFPFLNAAASGLTEVSSGDGGSNTPYRATIWAPVSALPEYVALGHVVEPGPDPPSSPVAVYFNNANSLSPLSSPLLARPLRYELIWRRISAPALTLWSPVAPLGYVGVGSVAVAGSEAPPSVGAGGGWCVREDATRQAEFYTGAAWTCTDSGGGGDGVTLWPVDSDAFTFIATRGGHAGRPAAGLAAGVVITPSTVVQ